MALELPAVLKIAKNEIASIYPWLFLIDLELEDDTKYHFVHNTENIIFSGQEYTKFPFQIELPEIDSEGNIPTWKIRVSNVLRVLEAQLQEKKGIVDSKVTITIVNYQYLSENYIDLQTKLKVLKTYSDENWVTFECGGRNLFGDIFPKLRYLAGMCMWKFKWHECYYNDPTAHVILGTDGNDYICYCDHTSSDSDKPITGSNWRKYWRRKDRANTGGIGGTWQSGQSYSAGTEECKSTLEDCRAKGNSRRYGGFLGLNNYGIKMGG